jgi:beta-mannosidase
MRGLSLDGEWEIIERPLTDGPEAFGDVERASATLVGRVPGDVSDDLVRGERLPEPLVGTNFTQFRWVEERSWWYRRRFDIPGALGDAAALELVLGGLDVHADVWLNGAHLGHHASAFYPFECDVSSIARRGSPNELVVRLTTGVERAKAHGPFDLLDAVPTEASRGYPERGMEERIFLRKPAYTWGWDWAPHLATCGITGNCEIRAYATTEIADVALASSLDGAHAIVRATVEIEHRTNVATRRADVALQLVDEDGTVHEVLAEDVLVRSGRTYVEMALELPDARLWWPNGSGEQHRYTVDASLRLAGAEVSRVSFPYGVRTVHHDTSSGRFAFLVNGVPVFVKGGNWVPSDSLYGRITPEKVTDLVEQAADANMNCLRIWGGGRFEQDAFYEACDRRGIMLWHDFMSACAPLPGDEAWFVDEFRNEARYQVCRLRNRACMALWCGNNEVAASLGPDRRDPAWHVYHRMLPQIVHELAPQLPYWPTSPYGGERVASSTEGDDHHWVVMRPEKECWSSPEYWDQPGRSIFNSEYGYGGPCCIESTRQYMGTDEPDLFSETGRQHTNSFYDIQRVNFSIKEHYRDVEGLALADYILLGGLCQGLNYGYSLESLRANDQTMGGIFWMYDDAWGENGWTIVDYYLRRKVSYYNVKRCLTPRRLVLRPGGLAFGGEKGEVLLIALNETPEPLACDVQFGYVSYDGSVRRLGHKLVSVAPRSACIAASLPMPDPQALAVGTVVAIPREACGLESTSFRHRRFRDAGVPQAEVRVLEARREGADLVVDVSSATFAHAVHFDVGGGYRLSDHYFDLVPGERRTVRIHDGASLDAAKLTARSVGSDGST